MSSYTILQIIPNLNAGGAEVGCLALGKDLKIKGHTSMIATASGQMIHEALRNGIVIIQLPLDSKSPLKWLYNAYKLAKLIRLHGINLLHVRSRAPAWSVLWAAKATSTPWVSTYHGAYKQQNRLKKYYNGIMTRGNAIIAPSQFMAQHIVEHYPLCAVRMHTILRGIDFHTLKTNNITNKNALALANQWEIKPNHRVILLPARFTRLKGHFTCIEAASKIKDLLTDQHVKIIFVGQHEHDHYFNSIQKTIKDYKLNHIIQIEPHCLHLQDAYALSELVLICSTQPESFGRTAVEAQAMGCLVIGTNHGGCKETILHEKTGFLYPPGNSKSLADQISIALNLNPVKKKSILKNSKDYAMEHFNEKDMLKKTIALYETILKSQPGYSSRSTPPVKHDI